MATARDIAARGELGMLSTLAAYLEGETWDQSRFRPRSTRLLNLQQTATALWAAVVRLEQGLDRYPDAPVDIAWCLGKLHEQATVLGKHRDRALASYGLRWARIAIEIQNLLRPERPA